MRFKISQEINWAIDRNRQTSRQTKSISNPQVLLLYSAHLENEYIDQRSESSAHDMSTFRSYSTALKNSQLAVNVLRQFHTVTAHVTGLFP